MTRAARSILRAAVCAVAALLVAAATGWFPFAPALALGLIAVVAIAAETFLALAARTPGRSRSAAPAREALADTSALIDGRLSDLAETGFLGVDLLVPEFVLRELQHVADAPDAMRRARGRRGLDVLAALRASSTIRVRVVPDDVPDEREVDLKLVEIARRRGAALVTTDFNLNKVAGIRGVTVLNVNDLAHALRPVVLPGESMRVTLVKEGKEPGQGVAYLEDGTMVVVDQGRPLIGRAVDVVVTSAIQTAAGKMFFAKLAETPSER